MTGGRNNALIKNSRSDLDKQQQLSSFQQAYLELQGDESLPVEAVEAFHWLIEEFRVSLFAQELKTAQPVSAKRLRNALSNLQGF